MSDLVIDLDDFFRRRQKVSYDTLEAFAAYLADSYKISKATARRFIGDFGRLI